MRGDSGNVGIKRIAESRDVVDTELVLQEPAGVLFGDSVIGLSITRSVIAGGNLP